MAEYETGMVRRQGEAAKIASRTLGILNTKIKNDILESMADGLLEGEETILAANAVDMENGKKGGLRASLLDRLLLTHDRLVQMAMGIRQVADLPDPVGRILSGANLPNGLTITKVSVPLGVIGIIYEARPNVTADAIALCVKSGNAVILKGGREALHSNKAVSDVLIAAGEKVGLPKGSIQFVNVPDRAAVDELIHLEGLVDVVIPRGGAGLIKNVVHNASVPVIETGAGVCHTYVDAYANVPMAVEIAMNAKVNRPSTCNAMETLLVHRDIADVFLPAMLEAYKKAHVTILGDERTQRYSEDVQPATEEDWATEYGDLRLSVKVVDSLEEAVEHIRRYGTGHSEAIVTDNYANARKFQQLVDAAAVYVNASTRFTDGFEFGFGAEIGISTQKLHARGPMGLPELTTTKYLVNGNGQVRK
ncbi:glutamate-5-semialdehyde dehydrogenase [Acidaminococcus timonensis]|uniref:glutamate-5-semialdehyde dehydrogenase n=1 Tax=Acidaminococcus timonensis TaxID=1871002 RepID=UPI0029430442|nr:glutamate-5-semialdehyde dehydrogenase [Acidaminococcus timonensis]